MRILVLGGARSGKSQWAEALLDDEPVVTYVATSLPRPDDLEWNERIAVHRKRRPATWLTAETLDIAPMVDPATPTLVECVTLWLSAFLDDPDVEARADALVHAVATATGTVVLVSNEVGQGVVPPTEAGRHFRDALGSLNARLAAVCDEVWFVTAGIPARLT